MIAIYFILWGVLALSGLWMYSKYNTAQRMYAVFAFICLTLFVGLQYGFATDYPTYMRFYDYYSYWSWDQILAQSIEIGYKLLNLGMINVGVNYFGFVFICAVFINGSAIYYFYKNCSNMYLCVIAYVSFGLSFVMNGALRQGLAFAITLWAFELCRRKKFAWFVFFVLIAYTIHGSVLFMLIIYMATQIRISLILSFFILAGSGISTLFLDRIYLLITRILPKYASYVTTDYFTASLNIFSIFIPFVLYLVALIFTGKFPKGTYQYYNYALLGMALAIFQLRIAIFDRMTLYTCVLSLPVIPLMVSSLKDKNQKRFAVLLILFAALAFYCYKVLLLNGGYPQYETIFAYL